MPQVRAALLTIFTLTLATGNVLHAQRGGERRVAEANGWIYGDFAAGLRQARQTGKPLMVVIRCPP